MINWNWNPTLLLDKSTGDLVSSYTKSIATTLADICHQDNTEIEAENKIISVASSLFIV